MFHEKSVLKNFTKFTGKHLCQSLVFNDVVGLGVSLKRESRPETLLKKRLWHRFFPVNFPKFLRAPPNDCIWLFHFPIWKSQSHSLFPNKSLFSFRLSATEKYLLNCFYWFRFQPLYICLSVFISLYVSPPQKKEKKNWVEDYMIRSFIKTVL